MGKCSVRHPTVRRIDDLKKVAVSRWMQAVQGPGMVSVLSGRPMYSSEWQLANDNDKDNLYKKRRGSEKSILITPYLEKLFCLIYLKL